MFIKSIAMMGALSSVLFFSTAVVEDVEPSSKASSEMAVMLDIESLPYVSSGPGLACGGCHTDCAGDTHAVWGGFPGNAQTHQCFGPEYCPNHPKCSQTEEDLAFDIIELWEQGAPAMSELKAVVEKAENAWFNVERGAIQISLCGTIAANLPLSHADIQALTE